MHERYGDHNYMNEPWRLTPIAEQKWKLLKNVPISFGKPYEALTSAMC